MTDLITQSTVNLLAGLPSATQLDLLTSTLTESDSYFSPADLRLLTDAGIPIPPPTSPSPSHSPSPSLPINKEGSKLGTKQFTIASSPIFSIYFQGPYSKAAELPPEPTPELLPELARAGCIKVRAIGHPSTTPFYRKELTAHLRTIINHEPPITGSQYRTLIHTMLLNFPQLVVAMGGLPAVKDRLLNTDRLTAAYSEWLAIQPLLPATNLPLNGIEELPTVADIDSLFDSL